MTPVFPGVGTNHRQELFEAILLAQTIDKRVAPEHNAMLLTCKSHPDETAQNLANILLVPTTRQSQSVGVVNFRLRLKESPTKLNEVE